MFALSSPVLHRLKLSRFDFSSLFKNLPGIVIESDERKERADASAKHSALEVQERDAHVSVLETVAVPLRSESRVEVARTKKGVPLFLRFGNQEQSVFAKRLAMILKAGIPILEGLHMVKSQTKGTSSSYIYRELISHVESGQPLSSGLGKFNRIFGDFAINIVRVGETSGTLHENLNHLAEELKKKEVLKKKIVGALVYPAVVMVATFGISGILTVYIFPKIAPIFQSFKTQLPLSTRMLIAISTFLLNDGLWLLLGIVGAAILYAFLLKTRRFHLVMDHILLRLPLFGKMSKYFNCANIARTLSLLLKSDLGVVSALQIVAESTQNRAYRLAMEEVMHGVGKGQRISLKMMAYPHLFPPLMTQMVTVGEQTGNLTGSLMYLSEMYEEEIADLTKNMTTMLEPALMIVMGVVVGFIAISIITPIYGITSSISVH